VVVFRPMSAGLNNLKEKTQTEMQNKEILASFLDLNYVSTYFNVYY
jgi:hypothetical protein